MPDTYFGGVLTVAVLVAITAIALDRTITPAAKLGRRLLGRVGAAVLAGAALVAFVIVTSM